MVVLYWLMSFVTVFVFAGSVLTFILVYSIIFLIKEYVVYNPWFYFVAVIWLLFLI